MEEVGLNDLINVLIAYENIFCRRTAPSLTHFLDDSLT